MNSISILPAIFLIIMCIGFGILFMYMGILTLRKRPVAFNSNIMIIPFSLVFIIIIVMNLSLSFTMFTETPFSWIWLLLIPLLILVPFIMKKQMGNLMILNIEEDILYESLFEVLKASNISYEEKRGKILLPKSKSEIKISPHATLKYAYIHLKLKDKGIRKDLVHDLNQIFIKKIFDKLPIYGIFFIIAAIIFFALTPLGFILMTQSLKLEEELSILKLQLFWLLTRF